MLRITYRITRNRQDAEDAVQECFLNAFLHPKNFDGSSRFSTWLTRIAMNAALMKLRKNHASREVPIAVSVETSELCSEHQVSDFSPNPEELCTKSEREATLRDAIAKLRPSIRKGLEIHKRQERSLEETATVLGISVWAVKARVFHEVYIKRIVALPGETVEIRQGMVFVNGNPLPEPYVPSQYEDLSDFGPEQVPGESYFVMGDHRNRSHDSRVFGPVASRFISGRAVFAYWPVDRFGSLSAMRTTEAKTK
jgi:RNA polymerase sigma-70 factor (ECF subfamily)